MRSLSSRLLITQISICLLVSLLLGVATLALARTYFLDSIESAMDTQALLIHEALFPGSTVQSGSPQIDTAFNTMQQQVGNLSVEIQGVNTDPALASSAEQMLNPQIEAFEVIDLAVAYVNSDGKRLLQTHQSDLPPSFGDSGSIRRALQGESRAELVRSQDTAWLVKSYPLVSGESPQGVLTLGQPLAAFQAVLTDLGWIIASASLAALAAASVVSILSSRGLLAPIAALTRASRSIPQGRFEERLPTDRRDELGELSRTFEVMRAKLEALEKLRAQFVSDVSHELRTPLTAIKGLAETLQDGAIEDPEVRDRFLASIEQETDRLIRMTHDLLTLTRIDGESLITHPIPLDLLATLQKTLVTLHPAIEAKQLQITVDAENPEITVVADQDRLIQILFNLLDNAIQHAPTQSAIRVQTQMGSIREASILSILNLPRPFAGHRPALETLKETARWVILQIEDQGPGIPPNDLPHVFERFYRVDTARSRSSGGAGLGLSIAQALVQAQDGHLWLHSPVNPPKQGSHQGTLAILILPAAA